jgi:hypothetical protein
MKRCLVIAAAVASSACSDVSVTGSFDGRELHVSGTVLAWLDQTFFQSDPAGGTPILVDRGGNDVVMHLRFSEAVFDPRVDFRTLPSGERETLFADMARGDLLAVEVARGSAVRPGDELGLVTDGNIPEVLPYITQVDVKLGEPVLAPDTQYPERVERIASDRTATLDVRSTSPELEATLTVKAKRGEDDGEGYAEGSVTVDFHTELLPERIAECNFAPGDQGVADACNPR